MNLNDFKPELTSENINNLVKKKFGVELDISKLNVSEAGKILLGLKESLGKNKKSRKAQTSHQNAAYMQKLLVVETLERYIAEAGMDDPFLLHSKPKKKQLDEQDNSTHRVNTPNGVVDKSGKRRVNTPDGAKDIQDKPRVNTPTGVKTKKLKPVPEAINYFLNRMVEAVEAGYTLSEETVQTHVVDPREINALRILVGQENYINAKRAIEYARRNRPIPPAFLKGFIPILDMLENIMRGGMTYVRIFKMLDQRARKQLGIEEGKKGTEKALRALYEGTAEEAEVVLAAKDMVDTIQDMVSNLGELQNEELNPLGDKIRSQFGDGPADAFLASAGQSITAALAAITQARSEMDQTSRMLSAGGDESMMMGDPVEAPGMEGPMEPDTAMSEPNMDDDFGASDAAMGGEIDVGRERRESIERRVSKKLSESQDTLLRMVGVIVPEKKKLTEEQKFENFLKTTRGTKLRKLREKARRIQKNRPLKISEQKIIKLALKEAGWSEKLTNFYSSDSVKVK